MDWGILILAVRSAQPLTNIIHGLRKADRAFDPYRRPSCPWRPSTFCSGAKDVFTLLRDKSSRRRQRVSIPAKRLSYLPALEGFLPPASPCKIAGDVAATAGLGLTALGFLASRLLRF